jgi:sigma-B regulation protein RsbU (phosphoserine phosphatase)
LSSFVFGNTASDRFITFFYGIMDLRTRMLVYTNAGQNPPLIIRAAGEIVPLSEGGLPLGLMPDVKYDFGTVSLRQGDLLLIYTDGVPEAMNAKHEVFGEGRVQEVLTKNHVQGASATCNALLEAVSAFCGGQYEDDLTLLALSLDKAGS